MVVKKFGFGSQVAGKGIDQGAVVAAVDGRRVDHDGFLKAVAEAAGRGGTICVEFSTATLHTLGMNGWKVLTPKSHRTWAHLPRTTWAKPGKKPGKKPVCYDDSIPLRERLSEAAEAQVLKLYTTVDVSQTPGRVPDGDRRDDSNLGL